MSVVAYHFWSPTCGPCKVIKPAIEDLKEEFPLIKWITVNTHSDPEGYASNFGITVVPTIVVVSRDTSGTVLATEKFSGTQMAGYYRIIRNAMRSAQLL
jgi:thiol-disulfide isomerase/thioredoxin